MPAAKPESRSRSASPKPKKSFSFLQYPDVLKNSASHSVPVHVIRQKDFAAWNKARPAALKAALLAQDWTAAPDTVALTFDQDGSYDGVYIGASDKIGLSTFATAVDVIQKRIPSETVKKATFALGEADLSQEEITTACVGWSLACYQFDAYKTAKKSCPALLVPKAADKARIEALVRSVCLIRNLINLPANALGPEELAASALEVAQEHGVSAKIIEDKKLLSGNFPLIFAVGDGSARRPRLIDMSWGNPKDPKVTIVGKGVCFDSGGYDIKPSSAMLTMKKDMGGAAMALGLFWMVAALKLPIRLRVLIPAVENSVSGSAYRPMDILPSRKGLSVEIGNTDAEGRLVMADCLTLACEEKPDLLIDFSTLTGAARAAVGLDITAMFSNNDELARELQALSLSVEDPVWQMPLWQGYRSDIQTPNADLTNSGNNVAGAITAALFLESFVEKGVNWIHLDHSAWEGGGRPGRPRGGADMGMRAVLALLESRYGRAKARSAKSGK